MEHLERQLAFVIEIDKLKTVVRQTLLTDSSRRENSAEHSWHLAIMAQVLQDYAEGPVDITRVIRMLLVHDIVEIDAGDTFAFDVTGYLDKSEREHLAAARIFGLLPQEQGHDLRALWEEFELMETPDSQYANALDRLQPLLHNSRTEGGTWKIHNVSREEVLKRMEPIRLFLPKLYPVVERTVEHACAAGWIS